MTIAATYPAAVIGMAVLRLMKGSMLEENIARTVGSIGESVAAGAIFTIPAFVISGAWTSFDSPEAYWKSTALMIVGGILGILFVTLLRRVMVEDPELPFPESVAASEIHKAGQQGSQAAGTAVPGHGLRRAGLFPRRASSSSRASKDFIVSIGSWARAGVRLGSRGGRDGLGAGGITTVSAPERQPGLPGRRLHHRPELAALNFAGGVLAWGLLVPLLIYFLGPAASGHAAARRRRRGSWGGLSRRGVEIHRAADRRGRHAGGRRATRSSACARTWPSA